MTPSCRNCHSTPAAKAPEPSALRLSNDEKIKGCAEKCPSEKYIPQWLGSSVPQLQGLEWWTRSNFEKALKEKQRAEGKPALPFRIFVKAADLEAHLYPQSFDIETPLGNVRIASDEDGEISSAISIRDNQIPLLMQSLVNFTGVSAGLWISEFLETHPKQISVGNYGDLHFILSPEVGVRSFLDIRTPMMTPTMPIGYDFPYGNENMNAACSNPSPEEAKRLDCPPTSDWIYQDRSDPKRDLVLTQFLAAKAPELLSPQGRLPKAYGVEDLILRVLQLLQRSGKGKPASDSEAPPPPSLLKNLLSYLKPGSHLTLSLSELEDFFLPGAVDLGPSEGKVELTVGGNGELIIEMSEFTINLDAMDYPNRETWEAPAPDSCQPHPHVVLERPGMRVHQATIYPGAERTNSVGDIQKPGIHAIYYPSTQRLALRANLHIAGEFTLPVGGHVDASGDMLVATMLKFTEDGSEDGPKVIPQTTTLELRDWNLLRASDANDAKGPPPESGDSLVAQGLEVSLTDDPRRKGFLATPAFAEPEFEFQASALFPGKKAAFKKQAPPMHRFETEGTWRAPQDENGLYDFAGLKTETNLAGRLRVEQGGGHKKPREEYTASFELVPSPTPILKFRDEGIDYTLRANLEKSVTPLNPKNPPEVWSLFNGLVLAVRQEKLECVSTWDMALQASQVQVPRHNGIQLNGIQAAVKLDRLLLTQDAVNLAIPVLDLSVNSNGSSRGPLRGEISLHQSREEKLEIAYDRANDTLLIRGLDVLFRAQGLHVLNSNALLMLDRGIRSMELDGRLLGNFEMSVPEEKDKWTGSGLIQVRGDSQGDIFFQNGRGKRVGPPLLRNSEWNLRRIRSINWRDGYILANEKDYDFSLIFNLEAVNVCSSDGSPPVDGFGSCEMPFRSGYNNQPFVGAGFENFYKDYIRKEYRLTPETETPETAGEALEGGTP